MSHDVVHLCECGIPQRVLDHIMEYGGVWVYAAGGYFRVSWGWRA